MNERQRELVWAFGVILVGVTLFMTFAYPGSNWFYVMTLSVGPIFTYIGARTLLDKSYRIRTGLRNERIAADANKKPFDAKKMEDRLNEPVNKTTSTYWAFRLLFSGLILLAFDIAVIAKYFGLT